MVILLTKSELSLNGSDAKRHAQGVPVTGARVLRRGHDNAARKMMLSGRDRVSCAEPWERSADTVLRVSTTRNASASVAGTRTLTPLGNSTSANGVVATVTGTNGSLVFARVRGRSPVAFLRRRSPS